MAPPCRMATPPPPSSTSSATASLQSPLAADRAVSAVLTLAPLPSPHPLAFLLLVVVLGGDSIEKMVSGQFWGQFAGQNSDKLVYAFKYTHFDA